MGGPYAAMLLAYFSRHIPVSAPERLGKGDEVNDEKQYA